MVQPYTLTQDDVDRLENQGPKSHTMTQEEYDAVPEPDAAGPNAPQQPPSFKKSYAAGLVNAANAASFGFLPRIASVAEGNMPGSESYNTDKQSWDKLIGQTQQQDPYAAGAGSFAGSALAATAAAPAVGYGMLSAGLQGGMSGLGSSNDLTNLKEDAGRTALGAGIGALGQKALQWTQPVSNLVYQGMSKLGHGIGQMGPLKPLSDWVDSGIGNAATKFSNWAMDSNGVPQQIARKLTGLNQQASDYADWASQSQFGPSHTLTDEETRALHTDSWINWMKANGKNPGDAISPDEVNDFKSFAQDQYNQAQQAKMDAYNSALKSQVSSDFAKKATTLGGSLTDIAGLSVGDIALEAAMKGGFHSLAPLGGAAAAKYLTPLVANPTSSTILSTAAAQYLLNQKDPNSGSSDLIPSYLSNSDLSPQDYVPSFLENNQ